MCCVVGPVEVGGHQCGTTSSALLCICLVFPSILCWAACKEASDKSTFYFIAASSAVLLDRLSQCPLGFLCYVSQRQQSCREHNPSFMSFPSRPLQQRQGPHAARADSCLPHINPTEHRTGSTRGGQGKLHLWYTLQGCYEVISLICSCEDSTD